MSWTDPDDAHWDELNDTGEVEPPRWPLHWHGLYPHERWIWFEQLWTDVCRLRQRYRLPLRSGWWTNQIQVEALAALAAWVDRYDSGASGTTPQGSSAFSTTSSASRRCCVTATSRFTPTATGSRSRAT